MKDTFSQAESSAAGVYSTLIGGQSSPMNGSSKRKSSNPGSSTGSNKKRTVYMDTSGDDEELSLSSKVGSALYGTHGPVGKKKGKRRTESANAAGLFIQEQRKQLPIAQGDSQLRS